MVGRVVGVKEKQTKNKTKNPTVMFLNLAETSTLDPLHFTFNNYLHLSFCQPPQMLLKSFQVCNAAVYQNDDCTYFEKGQNHSCNQNKIDNLPVL